MSFRSSTDHRVPPVGTFFNVERECYDAKSLLAFVESTIASIKLGVIRGGKIEKQYAGVLV